MYCIGCDQYFCAKDFRGHREGIFGEMDKIVESRNQLQETINNSVQLGDQNSPVIAEIDNWEKTTIKKVQEVAAQAREQTIQLLNVNRVKIQTEFRSFSQELAALKESEDFVEHDLARLNKLISQFKTDIQQAAQPMNVKFHTEQSDKINWETLIFVEEIRTNNNQPTQQAPPRKFRSLFSPGCRGTVFFRLGFSLDSQLTNKIRNRNTADSVFI